MYHAQTRTRTRGWLVVLTTLAMTLTMTTAASAMKGPSGDGPGNKPNAKECHKGGWEHLLTADGDPFANEEECVAYAAQGGEFGDPAAVYARAWSTTPKGEEVLIAQIVDTNGNGDLDEGDTVQTNQYPLDHDATDFGSFGVTSHEITDIDRADVDAGIVFVSAGPDDFAFESGAFVQQYYERIAFSAISRIADGVHSHGNRDEVTLNIGGVSPSEPEHTGDQFPSLDSPDDDGFIDVEITLPTG